MALFGEKCDEYTMDKKEKDEEWQEINDEGKTALIIITRIPFFFFDCYPPPPSTPFNVVAAEFNSSTFLIIKYPGDRIIVNLKYLYCRRCPRLRRHVECSGQTM